LTYGQFNSSAKAHTLRPYQGGASQKKSLNQVSVSMNSIPMTRRGYNKIKDELERLENVEMPKIVEKLAAAREEGDLKENAEYHGQREAQGMMQAKINLLADKLSRADIVDRSKLPKGEIVFGCTVVVKDLDYNDEEEITLVGEGDEDYDTGRYLITSPIGQGLLGKKKGEKVEIPVPRGTIKYEVLEIRFEEDDEEE